MITNPTKNHRRIIYARFEMYFWYLNIIFWPFLSGWIKPEDPRKDLIEITYFVTIIMTILSIYMIIQCRNEIKMIFKYFDNDEFRKKIQNQTQEIYKLNQATKLRQQIINKTKQVKEKIKYDLAPIYPDKDGFIRKWEADQFDPTIINGFWAEDFSRYEIKCPAQLRDKIILMQNSLPDIFEEILNSNDYKEIHG